MRRSTLGLKWKDLLDRLGDHFVVLALLQPLNCQDAKGTRVNDNEPSDHEPSVVVPFFCIPSLLGAS